MIGVTEVGSLPAVSATIFLVICVAFLLKKKNGTHHGKRLPPCLPALPIVGSLPFVRGGLDVLPKTFLQMSKKLGTVFSFYSGSNYVVVLNGKSVFDGLLKKAEAFADRPVFWTEVNLLNPNRRGMVFAPYTDLLKKYHKLFLSIMKELGFGITQESDNRIWNEVERLIENIRKHNGQPLDPKKMVLHSTANVMMTTLFGEEFQKKEHQIDLIIKNANKWVESYDPIIDVLPILRFVPLYRRKLNASKKAQEDLMASLEEAVEDNKPNAGKSTDISFTRRFLEILGPEYDHKDLIYLLRDVTAASSDTVVESVLWLLIEMANHLEVQARIQQELDEAVPDSRLPSYDDRSNLPYTEATTFETQRLHTILPFSILHHTSKETEIGGYFIPKCMIIPNLYSVHMDPDIWTDPENFRPERLLDKDNKIIGKENMIPFSVGKRSCIGEVLARQEVFVFFASLLQQFEIRPPEGDKVVFVTVDSGVTVGPSPFQLRFIPRKSA